MLVFSVTQFNIDQNQTQNLSMDEVQSLGNERRYIYKDPRQDSRQRSILYTRYPKKRFTQTYRDLYGVACENIRFSSLVLHRRGRRARRNGCFCRLMYEDVMLVLTWMSSNMADGNQQKFKRTLSQNQESF